MTTVERLSSRNESKPLRVAVMDVLNVAHQTFAMKLLMWLKKMIGLSEAFRDIFSEIIMKVRHLKPLRG